jgi:hypothetical protein
MNATRAQATPFIVQNPPPNNLQNNSSVKGNSGPASRWVGDIVAQHRYG